MAERKTIAITGDPAWEIVLRPTTGLRPHPENGAIFGDPEESKAFDEVCTSIKTHGIREPLIIKDDGTVLSGHLRLACARKLRLERVPARVLDDCGSYFDEVRFLVQSNTDRRQLTPQQIAMAFKRLKEIPKEAGGAKRKVGRPEKGAASGTLSKSRDDAAKMLNIGRHAAEALEDVFTTPGVPDELKAAVNAGTVAPTTAAKAVRSETKRQGGAIKSPTALVAIAERKPEPPADSRTAHEARVEDEAKAFRADFAALLDAYRTIDSKLTRRPLSSVLGPTEHHEYRGLIHDIAIRAWREIEGVDGVTATGKQMALIRGGKS